MRLYSSIEEDDNTRPVMQIKPFDARGLDQVYGKIWDFSIHKLINNYKTVEKRELNHNFKSTLQGCSICQITKTQHALKSDWEITRMGYLE